FVELFASLARLQRRRLEEHGRRRPALLLRRKVIRERANEFAPTKNAGPNSFARGFVGPNSSRRVSWGRIHSAASRPPARPIHAAIAAAFSSARHGLPSSRPSSARRAR